MTDVVTLFAPFAALAIGLAAGLFHFSTLGAVTRLYLQGGFMGRAVALQILRLGLLAAVLAALAFAGAVPLMAGALGLLIGRAIVLRRKRGDA